MIILVYNKGCDIVRKLNNKGFAISTVLYGLLIVLILITTLIITTMSSSRKSSRQFTDNITRNLEKVPKSSLTNKTICLNEANSFVITEFDNKSLSKEKMCNNIISNLKDLNILIDYNIRNNIHFFRLSSKVNNSFKSLVISLPMIEALEGYLPFLK